MKYLECDNYTVVFWHWNDCGSNRSVCLYLAGMWHHCTSYYILADFVLLMSHQLCAYGYA